jgi:two-component system chemotaxis response regulator CheB
MSLRILVVDDTTIFRRVVSSILSEVPGVEVVGTASNGKIAMARIAALRPDLVTLDIEMPEMNGIEVLEAMRAAGITAGVIMLSALTARGRQMTVRALELGAFDFVTKPEGGAANASVAHLRGLLCPMIQAFDRRHAVRTILRQNAAPGAPVEVLPAPQLPAVPLAPARITRTGSPMVLIGVSTGGPSALAKLVPELPDDLGAPVFIVQHMPAMFTGPLAASLDKKSAIRVKEAEDGEIAQANCAYLAPGGRHMKLAAGRNGEVMVRITDDPAEHGCRPSVDYLFRSAALHFPGRSTAAILTGMGSDGTAGLRMLKRGGVFDRAGRSQLRGFRNAEEAIQAAVVDVVVPVELIAAAIVRSVREGRGDPPSAGRTEESDGVCLFPVFDRARRIQGISDRKPAGQAGGRSRLRQLRGTIAPSTSRFQPVA